MIQHKDFFNTTEIEVRQIGSVTADIQGVEHLCRVMRSSSKIK